MLMMTDFYDVIDEVMLIMTDFDDDIDEVALMLMMTDSDDVKLEGNNDDNK